MEALLERLFRKAPLAAAVRLSLGYAVAPKWLDRLFLEERGAKSVRKLAFSTAVELSSEVAFGMSRSLYQSASRTDFGASYSALYQRLRSVDDSLLERLVVESAERMSELLPETESPQGPGLGGYRLRIVDGNHLHRTDKRLKALRSEPGAARPGYGLAVFAPKTGMIVGFLPSQDAHRHETKTAKRLWQNARPGELWVADRAFCTREAMATLAAQKSHFVFREAKSYPRPVATGDARWVATIADGDLFEQAVAVGRGENKIALRRIELRLAAPTEGQEPVIRLLSNLPSEHANAEEIAALYRQRWRIENAFQRLEIALEAEVKTLGHPKAALLAMALALIGFNALTVVERHLEKAHAERLAGRALSLYYLAAELTATAGALLFLEDRDWTPYENAPTHELRELLLQLARATRVDGLVKHVRSKTDFRRKKEQVPRADVIRSVSNYRLLNPDAMR